MPARTFTDDAGRKSACRTRKSEPHNRCQPAAPARAVIPPETPLAKNRTSSRRRLRNFETMAAYERQGGFDGYAARASRGYAPQGWRFCDLLGLVLGFVGEWLPGAQPDRRRARALPMQIHHCAPGRLQPAHHAPHCPGSLMPSP